MEMFSELLQEVGPVGDHLIEIWEKLPTTVLAEEERRLKERFLDISSRLLALSQVRGVE